MDYKNKIISQGNISFFMAKVAKLAKYLKYFVSETFRVKDLFSSLNNSKNSKIYESNGNKKKLIPKNC